MIRLLWKIWRECRAEKMRVGQLLVNVCENYGPSGDVFYLEDDYLSAALDQQLRDRCEAHSRGLE